MYPEIWLNFMITFLFRCYTLECSVPLFQILHQIKPNLVLIKEMEKHWKPRTLLSPGTPGVHHKLQSYSSKANTSTYRYYVVCSISRFLLHSKHIEPAPLYAFSIFDLHSHIFGKVSAPHFSSVINIISFCMLLIVQCDHGFIGLVFAHVDLDYTVVLIDFHELE